MTVDARQNGQPSNTVERVATKLPYHENAAERITLGILTLFDKLRKLDTLQPDPINGRLFNQLFDLVTISKTTTSQEERILSDPRVQAIIPELRQIWGDAEYLLELEFARKVIRGAPSVSECRQLYESFPYLDQYRQLARMETNTLDTAIGEKGLPPVRKIAFLGSGPTPFSALCFRERLGPNVEIVNIDRSEEAIDHGQRMALSLGHEFSGNMSFVRAEVAVSASSPSTSNGEQNAPASPAAPEALALTDLSDCDLVHFAALIGETERDKRDLLIAVAKAMKPGSLIMLRSTDSLRQCLYPKMDVDCWEVLNVVSPVLATRYFGASTSLTTIVVSVDG
ncbi:nicotianamine synthase [Diaporthe amygdali]|uniref:nicotianamine synthase n=1 Tax=Phomopsis amygdali TaxID=1214568 RepID=UPI0022FEC315|nr:nicotianamine synthase [Diaporthe amygdali]KAJ0114706.1 nicotianamine synthase [Diaporthe amygdali]